MANQIQLHVKLKVQSESEETFSVKNVLTKEKIRLSAEDRNCINHLINTLTRKCENKWPEFESIIANNIKDQNFESGTNFIPLEHGMIQR